MLPFEFIVAGPPVSQQARHRARLVPWRAAVRLAAGQRWSGGAPPVEQDVCVEITHFFDASPPDVDNIVKPILDAVKGLVFVDDSQVTDLASRRRKLRGPHTFDFASPLLVDALTSEREFLHVRIVASPSDGALRFL